MVSDKDFVHLHVHTDYSLLDGAARVGDVVRHVIDQGQPAVAVTDHGNMAGVVPTYAAAKKALANTDKDLKVIPGVEAYHVPDATAALAGEVDSATKRRYHSIMLATDDRGYRNLMKMSSVAATENLSGKYPLTDNAMIERYSEGLVSTTGCLGSRFNQLLLADRVDEAVEEATRFHDIFGKGRYFIEVQPHDFPDQRKVTAMHVELSRRTGIPLLATNDTHYINRRDHHIHDALLCIQTGSRLSDEDRFRFESEENHMASAAEMWNLLPEADFPGACANTLLVAEMAEGLNLQLGGGHYLLPRHPDVKDDDEAADRLRELAEQGARERYGDGTGYPSHVQERIDHELTVIGRMGFDNYFLIVSDIVNWAKDEGIYVGPGRGSGAGSIIAYCTGITSVDPIRFGLIFERFLNPGRREMPDIDIDFEDSRRGDVRRYITRRFGKENVAAIATYGVLKPKSALKRAASVLGRQVATGQQLSNLFPGPTASDQISIKETLGDREDVKDGLKTSWDDGDAFRDRYDSQEDRRDRRDGQASIQEVIDLASGIERFVQNRGRHASGVLITPDDLTNYSPVTGPEVDGMYTALYDGKTVESLGALKVDILGLGNLTTIRLAVEMVRETTGDVIDIENIPLDDPKVFDLIADGDVAGLFQIESEGMRRLLRRMQADRFEDLAAVVALYRPGPMGTNMHIDYADRKNGLQDIKVVHPDLKELFKDTYGLMVYQEDLIRMVQQFAGFSATDADALRKATGKKDRALIAGQEQKFKRGVVASGHSAKLADRLWDPIPSFADYSFNKSHAVAYATVTYRTAWLKANYPAQFLAACIEMSGRDTVATFIQEAKNRGIGVNLPDVNESKMHVTVRGGSIYLGLRGMRDVGDAVVGPMMGARRDGRFLSIADFITRVTAEGGRLTTKSMSSLIHAGAFDDLHSSRRSMDDALPGILPVAKAAATDTDDGDDDLFGDLGDEVVSQVDLFDLDGPDYPYADRLLMEVEALGFFAQEHPFTRVQDFLSRYPHESPLRRTAVPFTDDTVKIGSDVTVYGVVTEVNRKKTSRGMRTTVTVGDDQGRTIDVVRFGDWSDDNLRNGNVLTAFGRVKEAYSAASLTAEGEAEQDDAGLEVTATETWVTQLSHFTPREDMYGVRYCVIELTDTDDLSKVQRMLEEFGSGDTPVEIVVGPTRVRLPVSVAISDPEVKELARLPRVSAVLEAL